MTAPPTAASREVAPGSWVAARRSVPSRVGPGPGLVVVALGLLVVGLSPRTTPSTAASSSPAVTLPGALPPVTAGGFAGLGILLVVLLAASFLPRLRDATRMLLSTSALAAAGLGLVVLAEDDGRLGSTPSAVSELLGTAPGTAATVVALLAPVVVHLAVAVVTSLYGASTRARVVAGSGAGLLALLVAGVGPTALAGVAAGASSLLLLAHLVALRTSGPGVPDRPARGAGTGTPEATTTRRTDLLPAALLVVAALGAELSGASRAVVATLAVLAVTATSERLARWRARGQLEVLARCLGGAVVVCVLLGLVLRAADPRGWGVAVIAVALAGLVVAVRLPRPPTPQYVRRTHVLVVRALPWALAAGVLASVALAQPRSGGPVAQLAAEVVSTSSSSLPPNPSAGPSIRLGTMTGTTVEVVVRSPQARGPLEIRTRIGVDDISYPLVWVTADAELSVEVALPEQGRFVVTLNDLTSPTPLQTLVVDR